MNKRQAKKYLRRCREPLDLRGRASPRQAEAWRKARGRWSPWKMRAIKMTFSVTREEVVGSTLQSRITEDIMAEEDRRVMQVLEETALWYQERMS